MASSTSCVCASQWYFLLLKVKEVFPWSEEGKWWCTWVRVTVVAAEEEVEGVVDASGEDVLGEWVADGVAPLCSWL